MSESFSEVGGKRKLAKLMGVNKQANILREKYRHIKRKEDTVASCVKSKVALFYSDD